MRIILFNPVNPPKMAANKEFKHGDVYHSERTKEEDDVPALTNTVTEFGAVNPLTVSVFRKVPLT